MKRIILAATLILIAFAANAEDHPKFRAGILANFSDYDGDATFPVADSSLGLQLYAQGQVSSNFAVEVGYFNSGGFDTVLSTNTSPGSCQVQDFCDTELSLSGFSISAVGYLPIGGDDNNIDLFGKVGGYDFDIDGWYLDLTVGRSVALTDMISLNLAAGISYSIDYNSDGSDFNNVLLVVSLPIALTDRATLTPYVAGTLALDAIDGFQDDEIFGGVSLSVDF